MNLRLKTKNLKDGFTLIELLVVISILGILAGLIISNVSGVRERARDVQRKNDLNQIKEALKMYHNDFDDYPASTNDGIIIGCGTTASPANCDWNGSFAKNSTTYMNILPRDPSWVSGAEVYYDYTRGLDRDSFTLYATLENKSDSEIGKSQVKCSISIPPAGSYYVCAN